MADEFWAGWDNYEVAIDEPENKYFSKTVTGDDGIKVVLIRYDCDGLTAEQWSRWE